MSDNTGDTEETTTVTEKKTFDGPRDKVSVERKTEVKETEEKEKE